MSATARNCVITCVDKGRGWRLSVALPPDVRRATGKRVHSTVVRTMVEARQVKRELLTRYYPPAPSAPRLLKCQDCQREMTREEFKGSYPCITLRRCATCRDKHKGRQSLSLRQRFIVFQRDNFTCQYCGRKAPDVVLHVDHKLPVVKGGGNETSNLITACEGCNLGKHDLAA